MQNFRPLSQKFSEISIFEKFEFLRFCLTLTNRSCHNSLNFWEGVGVKSFNSKFAQNLFFLYLKKVKKFKMNISLCYDAIIIYVRGGGDRVNLYILLAKLVDHSFMVPRVRNPCLPTRQTEKCSTPPCVSTRQSDCVRGVSPAYQTVCVRLSGSPPLPDWLRPQPDCVRYHLDLWPSSETLLCFQVSLDH